MVWSGVGHGLVFACTNGCLCDQYFTRHNGCVLRTSKCGGNMVMAHGALIHSNSRLPSLRDARAKFEPQKAV